jgi:hypothetical protein
VGVVRLREILAEALSWSNVRQTKRSDMAKPRCRIRRVEAAGWYYTE